MVWRYMGKTYRTIKNCLYKTVGRELIPYFNFVTVLSDVQQVINARPLTYNSKNDELNVITPNHFLKPGDSFQSLIISENNLTDVNVDDSKDAIVSSIEYRDVMFDKFRKLFMEEYLLNLRDRHSFSYSVDDLSQSKYLRLGALVIMKSPVKARPFWTYAKIIEFIPSSDGLVRSVKVLRKGNVVTTSIANLFPLELDSELTDTDENSTLDNSGGELVTEFDTMSSSEEDLMSNSSNILTSEQHEAPGDEVVAGESSDYLKKTYKNCCSEI